MAQRQLHDSPLKVLIFDNSADILELLTTDLQCRGCVVSTASVSGIRHGETDGVRLIEATAPDVIVFDVALPYEANWRVATDLQANPRVHAPFVLTTTNRTAVRQLIGRDLIELVGKPYDLDSLYDVIIRSVFPDMANGGGVAHGSDPSALPGQAPFRSGLGEEVDRRSGLDRRTTVRRQSGHAEPEFL
jgi:CheY-like chemotaxis protein